MGMSFNKVGKMCIVNLPANVFTHMNIDELIDVIKVNIADGCIDFYLNMSKINRIDGVGMGVLIHIQKLAHFNDISIQLYEMQPSVKQVLFQTKMNKVIELCEFEDMAQKLFPKRTALIA